MGSIVHACWIRQPAANTDGTRRSDELLRSDEETAWAAERALADLDRALRPLIARAAEPERRALVRALASIAVALDADAEQRALVEDLLSAPGFD